MKWCLKAAATCISTSTASSQASRPCQGLMASASALSGDTKSGSGNTPNHTMGKPAAELYAHPTSGTAKKRA